MAYTQLLPMADGIRGYDAYATATAHAKTCRLHDNETTKWCSGALKSGGDCGNKATSPTEPGLMPTCKTHRDQVKISGRCQAPMPCGFDCGQLFHWMPHGFNLCPTHCEYYKTCYFSKLPLELRTRIYQYLLPDKLVPARLAAGLKRSTVDGETLYTAILRVNHQIYDEAVGLLYGARTFTVQQVVGDLVMCNMARSYIQIVMPETTGNHALLDYQMQLMLLEQMNQKRIMAARQMQGGSNEVPSSTGVNDVPCIPQPGIHNISAEPIWAPPLTGKYFNMIRSFRIQILFPFPSMSTNGQLAPGTQGAARTIEKEFEWRLYDYIDILHKLVRRLQLVHRPIVSMEIVIEFLHKDFRLEEAFSASQLLLKPFQRLGNVIKPKVLSITLNGNGVNKVDILVHHINSRALTKALTDYLRCWSTDLSSSKPLIESPKIFVAYWKLEKLISDIGKTSSGMRPNSNQLADLRHAARMAREANNLEYFAVIWIQVVNIWFDYLNLHEKFQSKMELSIDDMNYLLGNESGMLEQTPGFSQAS